MRRGKKEEEKVDQHEKIDYYHVDLKSKQFGASSTDCTH
jgi:hypothetical protein